MPEDAVTAAPCMNSPELGMSQKGGPTMYAPNQYDPFSCA